MISNHDETKVINKETLAETPTNALDEPKKKKRKKRTRKEKAKIAVYTMAMLVIVGSVLATSITALYVSSVLKNKPVFDPATFKKKDATVLLDVNGNKFYDIGNEQRINLTYEQIPQVMIDSILSIEDARFFTHEGIDIPRIAKSMLDIVRNFDFGAGGSTITQQMIKDGIFRETYMYETSEQKVQRKIQEIAVALEAEKYLTKEEILTNYLNNIFYGSGAYGLEKASNVYFDKTSDELTLPEAALLAGIINAPSLFNPKTNLDNATKRQHTVLNQMVYHGYISQAECDAAKSIPVESLLASRNSRGSTAKYQPYIDAVVNEVKEATGFDPHTTPMVIHTYLNPGAQEFAEAILRGEVSNIQYADDYFETGFTVQETTTGRVVAVGGGRRYFMNGGGASLNSTAFDLRKQPGSTIKPLLDYAPAFDHLGYGTESTILDAPLDPAKFGNWRLYNANNTFSGEIPISRALAVSLNTPAARLYKELTDKLGKDKMIEQLKAMGFEPDLNPDVWGYSYAIGGFATGISPAQLTAAYAAFANSGKYIKPHTVNFIEYRKPDGNNTTQQIDSELNLNPTQLFSPAAAYMITTLLEKSLTQNPLGYGYDFTSIRWDGVPIYLKTGTTDYGPEGNPEYGIPSLAAKDHWIAGYSADYAIAVWTGYDTLTHDAIPYFQNYGDKFVTVFKIFREMMHYMHADHTVSRTIEQPSTVKSMGVVKGSMNPQLLPNASTPENMIQYGLFNTAGALPTETLKAPELTAMPSVTASLAGNNLSISLPGYADESWVTPDGETYTVPGYGGNFTVKRIFSPKLTYGYVQYVVEIRDMNGNLLMEGQRYNHDVHNNINITLPSSVLASRQFQVVAYYALSNSGVVSQSASASLSYQDTQAPTINNVTRNFSFEQGTPISTISQSILNGVSATDNVDGDVTGSVKVIGAENIQINTPGTYNVSLRASDSAGNITDDLIYKVSVTITAKKK